MDFIVLLGAALLGAVLVQGGTFVYALRAHRVDSIDISWGLSFIAAIVAMQIVQPAASPIVILTELLVAIWGTRLAWHIYKRFRHSDTQDERYTQIIQKWPAPYRSVQLFVKLFLLQAVLAVVISLPVVVIHRYAPPLTFLVTVGVLVWIVGFLFEYTADKQLKAFLAQRKHGALMTGGVWRYSRHPNYFGEVAMWWGIALIGLQTPLGPVGLIGALTITVLICFVSGVPLAEKRASSKPGWDVYRRKTSVLIPWPPKK